MSGSAQYHDTICRLSRDGYKPAEIHARLNGCISNDAIRAVIHEARLAGRLPKRSRLVCVTVRLPVSTLGELAAHAEPLDLLPSRLAALLLLYVLRDDLVKAVLADEPDPREPPVLTGLLALQLPAPVHERLVRAAVGGGIIPARLARRLLTVILRDGLVQAILDDEAEVS